MRYTLVKRLLAVGSCGHKEAFNVCMLYIARRIRTGAPMSRKYRVVDCSAAVDTGSEFVQMANSPEEAARLALGVDLQRSGHSRNLRAKVYHDGEGGLSLYRLYTRSLHPSG